MGQRATASPPRGRGGASRRAPCSRPVPLPLPPLQHRGQLPRVLHRPARPARSREPRIPAPPPLRAQLGSRRLRADLGERRGGSPPPTATACLSPPCSVLPSTLQNQPTRHSGPSSRRGGAGRGGKSGSPEEAAAARGVRSWNRLFCFLESNPLLQTFSSASSCAPQKRCKCGPWAS